MNIPNLSSLNQAGLLCACSPLPASCWGSGAHEMRRKQIKGKSALTVRTELITRVLLLTLVTKPCGYFLGYLFDCLLCCIDLHRMRAIEEFEKRNDHRRSYPAAVIEHRVADVLYAVNLCAGIDLPPVVVPPLMLVPEPLRCSPSLVQS